VETALVVSGALVTLPGLLTSLHLFVLAVASLTYREPSHKGPVPPVRFLVLIPAHNEEGGIGRTLESVDAVLRPGDQILVVADNCTDETARIARSSGAIVLERSGDPGRAEARQAGLDAARDLEWDAVLMVDADSVLEPEYLNACERAMAAGAPALQTRSEGARGTRLVDQATCAAFALQGVTIPRGRDRLGLLVRLRGTGMVLRRDVAERYRFRAPASEDLWYSLDLVLDGLVPRHVESAKLTSENAPNWHAASQQKERYEAGRLGAAKEFLTPLARRHTGATFEAAWFLASPPFAVATLSLLSGVVLGAVAGSAALVTVAGVALLVLAVVLGIALVQSRSSARTWLALVVAPWYVAWKLAVQLRAIAGLIGARTTYGPTERQADQSNLSRQQR
jgi:1,2-diacylglycerol 3-beta-glucosyltransferase